MKEFLRLEGGYLRALWWLGGFGALYVLGLLRADFYYVDDLYRSLSGNPDWAINGRPLMSMVTIAACDGLPLMDISPWGQLVSVWLLCYFLVLWGRKYLPGTGGWRLAGVLSFAFLNLFLLENLSYKYDVLGMCLALGLPFFIFAVPEEWGRGRLCLISIAGIMALLSLYQAATGAYLGLMVLEALIYATWGRSLRDMGRLVLWRLGLLLAGGALYKVLVAGLLMPADWKYGMEHAALVNPLSTEGLGTVGTNLATFAAMLQDYGMSITWLGILLLLAMAAAMILQLRKVWERQNLGGAGKLLLSALVVAAPVLLVLASVAALALLASPVFKARVMMSLSTFTLYLGVMVHYLGQGRRIPQVLIALSMICTLSLSSGYGNLLAAQSRLDHVVASQVLRDMNELEAQAGMRLNRVSYVGESPRSRELMLLSDKRPIYLWLVPRQDWWTGGLYIDHYRLVPMWGDYPEGIWEYGRSHEPVRSNEYYHMYVEGERVIVEFKEKY